MNYIKIILTDTASEGLTGVIVDGFNTLKRYNRGKNLVKVELANFELDPGESLEVGFVQCDESGNVSEDVETVELKYSLMSTTDDPKVYVAKVPDELFMADATHYNIEIRRVFYADVDGVGDELEVDTSDSATVGTVRVSARSLTREGTEPNVGDFVAIQDKVDEVQEAIDNCLKAVETVETGKVSKDGDEMSGMLTVRQKSGGEYRAAMAPLYGGFELSYSAPLVETSTHYNLGKIEHKPSGGARQTYTFPYLSGELVVKEGLSINLTTDENFVMTLQLVNEGKVLSEQSVDLPLESVVVDGKYDETTNSIILTLQNGTELSIPVPKVVDLTGITTNLRNGTGEGSVQQEGYTDSITGAEILGAKATGRGAVALGGQRYDKAGKDVAEEPQTEAKGVQSFAHGGGVVVEGDWSSGFGKDTHTYQRASHTEGGGTQAGMTYEEWCTANGKTNSVETMQEYEKSYGFAHAEGETNKAKGRASHSEGKSTKALADYAHSEGSLTEASGNSAHAEGNQTKASGLYAHAENYATQAIGDYSHSEGISVKAIGKASHAEGTPAADESGNTFGGQAIGEASHTEGYGCETAEGANASHAEGFDSKTLSKYAHSEGTHTVAGVVNAEDDEAGVAAHAEGNTTTASGQAAHSEGIETTASGDYAHAEGQGTTASGQGAHAQNRFTEASGGSASASGFHTKAGYMYQFVAGAFNENKEENVFELGGGSQESDRKNVFEVLRDGSAAYVGGKKVLTEDDSTGSGGTQLYQHKIDMSGPYLYIISNEKDAYTTLQNVVDAIHYREKHVISDDGQELLYIAHRIAVSTDYISNVVAVGVSDISNGAVTVYIHHMASDGSLTKSDWSWSPSSISDSVTKL